MVCHAGCPLAPWARPNTADSFDVLTMHWLKVFGTTVLEATQAIEVHRGHQRPGSASDVTDVLREVADVRVPGHRIASASSLAKDVGPTLLPAAVLCLTAAWGSLRCGLWSSFVETYSADVGRLVTATVELKPLSSPRDAKVRWSAALAQLGEYEVSEALAELEGAAGQSGPPPIKALLLTLQNSLVAPTARQQPPRNSPRDRYRVTDDNGTTTTTTPYSPCPPSPPSGVQDTESSFPSMTPEQDEWREGRKADLNVANGPKGCCGTCRLM